MSNNKLSGNNTHARHNYLNTQKSNVHTKVNKQLVQLWFGSASVLPSLSDSDSFKLFNQKCLTSIQHLVRLVSKKSSVITIALTLLFSSHIAQAEVAADIQNGSFASAHKNQLLSVDGNSGKATLLATIPNSIDGVNTYASTQGVNSLAINTADGLMYFASSYGANVNKSLFVYNMRTKIFSLLEADMSTKGVAFQGRGMGSGGAYFEPTQRRLYFGIEDDLRSAPYDSHVYSIAVDGNGLITGDVSLELKYFMGWGDFAVDGTTLYSGHQTYNYSTGRYEDHFTSWNLGTLKSQGDETISTDQKKSFGQIGKDLSGNFYFVVGNTSQFAAIDLTTGDTGTSKYITTNGRTSVSGGSYDAAGVIPFDSSISGIVWSDSNNDASKQTGETPIPNVTVKVYSDIDGDGKIDNGGSYNNTDLLLATDTTGPNGDYKVTGLPPGSYIIQVTDENGVLKTGSYTTPGGDTQTSTLTGSQENKTVNFGYLTPPGSISGSAKDPSNNPIQGAAITLQDAAGNTVNDTNGNPLTTTTQADGSYSFSNVPTGDYFIVESDPENYVSSSDADASNDNDTVSNTNTNDNKIPVTVQSNVTDSDNNFVDIPVGTISGSSKDTDGNPLAGVTITLKDIAGNTINDALGNPLTTTTQADGSYSFSNVPVGDYTLVETDPANYVSTNDGDTSADGDTEANSNVRDNKISVSVTIGKADNDNDFVNLAIGKITGLVKDDTGNLLANVTVALKDVAGNTVNDSDGNPLTTTTQADGSYQFNNVPVGSYNIVETNLANYTSTSENSDQTNDLVNSDLTDDKIPVTVTVGETDAGNVFIDTPPLSISGQVLKDTDAGNVTGAGLGNPDATPLYANLLDTNGNVIATTPVNADGSYRFDNVVPNTTYSVQINSTQGSNGNPAPAVTLPANWVATAEGINGTPDNSVDSLTQVVMTNSSVSNVLFGINKDIAPVAVDDNKSNPNPATPGNPTTLDIVANDTDENSNLDPQSVKLVGAAGTPVTTLTVLGEGEWTVNATTGAVTFTPEAGFTNDPTPIKYTIKDTTGLESNQATITVDYPQTAPTAIDDAKSGLTPGNPSMINVVTNDTDPENDLDPSTVKIVSSVVTGATLSIDGKTMIVPNEGKWTVDTVANDGTMTFTPDANFTGDPSPLRYTVADKTGKVSNEATVTLDYDSLRVISGHVGIDLNGDNTPEKDPLSPVTINLYQADGTTLVATTTTDQFGNYSFEVAGGNYVIKETDPTGVVSVTDKDGTNDNSITVDSSAGSVTGNDFVDRPLTGDVIGTVFKDGNEDGIHNNSELPLANINITVTDAYGIAHPVTTDALGDYRVIGLPVGPASIVVKSDDPDIPEGAHVTNEVGKPVGTPATVTVPAGGIAEHDIGYFAPVVANIDPASVATCANPSSITWEGSTVSSQSVWTDMKNSASKSFTTVGGKQVGVTLSLADTNSQFNYVDGSGTNAGIFNGPYLTMYLGKQANPSGTDGFQLNSGDSATLTITFDEEVLLDNWRIRDIDSGDKRGNIGGWDWQDAVKMTAIDAQGNPVTIDAKLGSTTTLVQDANGFVHTSSGLSGNGTDAALPEGHAVFSSSGVPIKTITLVHEAGPNVPNQTRSAIALSGFAICTPIEITGKVLNDGDGNANGVTGNPVNQLEGTQLYAHLVDDTGTVVDNVAVANTTGSYRFNKNININSNYTVVLSTVQSAKGISMPAPELPANWSNSSENITTDSAINGVIPVATTTNSVANIDFGLNKAPVATDITDASRTNPGGDIKLQVPAIKGSQAISDQENLLASVVFDSLPVDGKLYYGGNPVTVGQTILMADFDPALLLINPSSGNVTVSFDYHVVDAAGVASKTATVTMPFTSVPPVAVDDSIANTGAAKPENPATLTTVGSNDTDADGSINPATVDLDPTTPGIQNILTTADGEWSVDPLGTVVFTPNVNFKGTSTSIPYTLQDNDTNTSNEATLTVNYGLPPTATDDSKANKGIPSPANTTTLNVVANNDTDPDGTIDATTVDLDPKTAGIQKTLTTAEGDWSVDTAGTVVFTPNAGFKGTSTSIPYTVNDNDGNASNQATLTITYGQAPVAVDDMQANTGVPTPTNPTTITSANNNDSDPDGTINAATIDLDPVSAGIQNSLTTADGQWEVTPIGDVTFTPNTGFKGTSTTIPYTIQDNDTNTSNEANLTVTYGQGPTAVDDSKANKGVPSPSNPTTLATIEANDTDPDGTVNPATVDLDPATAGIQTTLTSADGKWTVDNFGNVVFVPNAAFTGTTSSIDYTIKDNDGNLSNVAKLTITYGQAPIAKDDSQANAGVPSVLNPTTINAAAGNDIDPDGTIDVTSIDLDPNTAGIQSSLTTADGEWKTDATGDVVFTPNAGFAGTRASIPYTVNDNDGNISNAAQLTVTYTQPPVATDDSKNNAGVPSPSNSTVLDSVGGNDSDPDGTIDTATVDLDPATPGIQQTLTTADGKWSVNGTGTVTFTPNAGFTGTSTTIPYTINDADGHTSNTANLTVVYGQAPIAVSNTQENIGVPSPTNPTVLKTVGSDDTDPDGTIDDSTVDLDPATPGVQALLTTADGKWSVNPAGDVTFTPNANFTGTSTRIPYIVQDNDGNPSNQADLTVTYGQAPTAVDDSASSTGVASPTNPVTLKNINDNDSDPDGNIFIASLDLDPVTPGTQNTLTTTDGEWKITAPGEVEFIPNANFTGHTSSIPYVVDDNDGNLSNTAKLTVTYGQAPVANDDSITANVGDAATLDTVVNDNDPDGVLDKSSVILTTTNAPANSILSADGKKLTVPNEGIWEVNPTTGTITFTPKTGFVADPSPVKYTVKDTDGNVSNEATLSIDYPQSKPVANDDEKIDQKLGTPVTLNVVDNDSDPENDLDPTTVKLLDPNGNPVTTLTIPGEGKWVVDPVTGAVTFTPETGFVNDPTPVKYSVKDSTGLESNQAAISIDYEASAALVGTIWLDRDKDGVIDPNEQRMAQWTLKIRDKDGKVVREVITNDQGEYAVNGLIPAEYSIEFYNKNGTLIATQNTNGALPASGPGSHPVNLSLPIDPSGVMYNSVTREPIPGVKLALLNSTGIAVDPACVGAGQQGQVTDETGMYAFDVNPNAHASCGDPETYTISIVNVPTDYYASSAQIPPQSGVYSGGANEAACTLDSIANSGSCEVQAQPDAPTGNQPTTFYTQFRLESGNLNIIFNHIPLDPKGGGDVLISKKVDKHQASIGDMLYYTIEVNNSKGLVLNDVDVVDDLPAGFQLVNGSAKLIRAGVDGLLGTADDIKAVVTPTGVDPMTFNDIDLEGNEKVRITYLMKVGASVIEGHHINTAQAINSNGAPTSNTAKATVLIVAEAVIDQASLIGKVFHDRDGDGYQDNANATGIMVKGSNGFVKHLGGLTGRLSAQDAATKHSKAVTMPLTSDNSFTITTEQGTHIEVDHQGQVTESHTGMKAKGITGQNLQVRFRKTGSEMEITVSNYGIHEEGIPGVRLATVTGLLIETDGHGRYHIPDVDGGRRGFGKNFILKVDKATLPAGVKFTTENPRVLRLTGAALNKINFGVKLPNQPAPERYVQQPAKYRTEQRSHVESSQQTVYQRVDVSLGSIFFDKDKYNIREDQRGIMDDIAGKIEQYGSGHITIDAFTDARHTAAYNIKLAERRANTVRAELQKRLGNKLMRNVKVDVDPKAYKQIPHNDPEAIDYDSNNGSLEWLDY